MRVPLMQSSRQPMAGLPRLRLRPGVWVRLRVMRWLRRLPRLRKLMRLPLRVRRRLMISLPRLPSVRAPLMQNSRQPMVRLQRLSLMSLLPRWLRLMRMR
ncbi:hypothetical protein A4X20_22595 [Mycolicibacterium iranicum]|uniref:Uncharacterized protein n=1 Tax=Mycolicibacterium iranicum TaxID=912594 RepID=A0A178LTG5_MYCIR|nr:hypothetical protein A4X20_22595 [Mycolicibacterium iranicum]